MTQEEAVETTLTQKEINDLIRREQLRRDTEENLRLERESKQNEEEQRKLKEQEKLRIKKEQEEHSRYAKLRSSIDSEDIKILEEKEGFYIVAYKKKMTIVITNTNSPFQPREAQETNDFCLIGIIQHNSNSSKPDMAEFIKRGAKHVVILTESQIESKLKEM